MRELLKEEKLILHPDQLYRWREITLTGLPLLFAREAAQEHAAK